MIPTAFSDSRRVDWILPVLAAIGFGSMLGLTIASAWLLQSAHVTAHQLKMPVDSAARTLSFFFAVFAGWAFVVYLWACCAFSQSRGRSWTWGLLALPATSSAFFLAWYGSPAFGLLCLLGLPGFLVPMALPVDRVLLAASAQTKDWLNQLARETTWVWALGLFVGATWAYGNSFRGEMTLDNKYIIEEYFHQVPRLIPPDQIYSPSTMVPLFFQNDYWWPKGISGLYRPVAVLSYWLNYTINHEMGNEPLDTFQYHVVNLFLHWMAACLGFVLIRQLSSRTSVAFFAALLFVTHPIATESVSNIIGRSDILAAITVFACLALYIRGTRAIPAEGAEKEKWWFVFPWAVAVVNFALVATFQIAAPWLGLPLLLVLSVTTFALPFVGYLIPVTSPRNHLAQLPWLTAMMYILLIGLFSKESAIAVVGLIIVYDVIYRWTMEDFRRAVLSLLAFSILSAIVASAALWNGRFGALGLSEGLTPALLVQLVGSLLAVAGLILAWVFWVQANPVSMKQLLSPWTKFFLPYSFTIPPIILWLYARGWVFANASPPETPFLDNPIRGLGFFAARMTASDVFIRLIGLLVWPIRLSCDYSFDQIPLFKGRLASPETWLAVAGCLTVLALIALIAFTFKRSKLICFLLVFYLIAYLPTANFLIIIGSIMAERFLYLPLIAFAAMLVLLLELVCQRVDNWRSRPRKGRRNEKAEGLPPYAATSSITAYALLSVLALGYGLRARFRNDDWLSDVTLWTAAAKICPDSFRCYQSKAFALYERYNARDAAGAYTDHPDLRNEDIDACYQTAFLARRIVDPLPPEQNSARLYLHLGMYYNVKGLVVGHFTPNGVVLPGDAGEKWFRLAEQILQKGVTVDRAFDGINRRKEIERNIKQKSEISDVGLPPIYSTLGIAYDRLGEWSKSLQTFQYCRHLEPIDVNSYLQIANACANLGRWEAESIALIETILIDQKQIQIWPALANALAQINHSGQPAITATADGKPILHPEVPEVRSVVCSAYQGLTRIFMLARRPLIAKQFRSAATNDWKFSSELFDDLVTDPAAESPVPPQPDSAQPDSPSAQ